VSAEAQKRRAALEAVKHVQSNMTLGLGTGSTARYATEAVGEKLVSGEVEGVRAVATSKATAALAEHLGIPLTELGGAGVDLAIDGIDEVTDDLEAIKGLGGALAREKIVEARARTLILIGDSSKRVRRLGERAPVPVEVLPFGWEAAVSDLEALSCRAAPRCDESGAFKTSDNGNYLIDCRFDAAFDAYEVAAAISVIPGVLEHGLFLGLAKLAYIATDEGVVELTRS
jgi:ribose 5-phosphate isomerase A